MTWYFGHENRRGHSPSQRGDLEALVRLAVAFRDHVGERTPSAEEFWASLAVLLHDASAEFFLARSAAGAAVGYVQCRYRYSAWMLALEAELEDVFAAARPAAAGWSNNWSRLPWRGPPPRGVARWASAPMSAIPKQCASISARSIYQQFVARKIWRRRGVFLLQCRAHRLQRRRPLRGLLVLLAIIFDLLQTARN